MSVRKFICGQSHWLLESDVEIEYQSYKNIISRLQAELDAAQKECREFKYLYENHARPFYEWAQSYLDGGRWAGHDLGNAIKTELLERDAQLKQAEAERDAAGSV